MSSLDVLASAVAAYARALTELAAGRCEPAREACARAAELFAAARGSTDPDVVNVLLTAAAIEQVAGDPSAARTHAAAAVAAAQTRVLDDPDLVGLRCDAEVLLATLDQVLGTDHAEAAFVRNTLEIVLGDVGRTSRKEPA
jgi:hypothetical protein